MAQAADLRAEDCVGSFACGREVGVKGLSRDSVLLETHLRNEEAVDDILRDDAKVDLSVDGEDKFAADEIVFACLIDGINSECVSCSSIDEIGRRLAEVRVSAGIAEVPGELYPGNFDLQCCRVCSCVALRCPESLSLDGERNE